jgi:hypothetical protein
MSAESLPLAWPGRARPTRAGHHPRALALLALLPLLATLLVHAASAADPVRTGRWLDAGAARRAGVGVQLHAPGPPAGGLVEIIATDGGPFAGELLALAPGGGAAAIVDAPGPAATTFALARADGSQLQVDVDGALAAAFSADGAEVAIVDGRGRLWSLDAMNGEMRPIAEGPFVDVPLIEPDGRILALAVPSVEAPFQSRLVRVSADGSQEAISTEELVYDASPLADGGLALVVHRPGVTQVRRRSDDGSTLAAELGPDAVNVTLSADGDVIAWERGGQVFVRAGGGVVAFGEGARPLVAPDGASVLVRLDGGARLLDLEGRELLMVAGTAAFAPCTGGCQP